jgi:hypothetical protein
MLEANRGNEFSGAILWIGEGQQHVPGKFLQERGRSIAGWR